MAGTGTQLAAVLGAVGKGFATLDQLADHLPVARNRITDRAGRLVTLGLLVRLEKGVFSLTPAGVEHLAHDRPFRSGPRGPHTGLKTSTDTLVQRAWSAMRRLGRFTVPELVVLAARGDEKSPQNNIQTYIRRLVSGGYVAVLPVRCPGSTQTSNGFRTFRLVRDTGVLAPVWSKGRIIDRNGQPQAGQQAALRPPAAATHDEEAAR